MTQCYAIIVFLSSFFHVYQDFPSQVRYYLLRNSMHHTGLAQGGYVSRINCSISYSLAISLVRCVQFAFIAGPSTVHSWRYSLKLSVPTHHLRESNTKYKPRQPCIVTCVVTIEIFTTCIKPQGNTYWSLVKLQPWFLRLQ